MRTVAIVGNGRAGGSLAAALRGVGWEVRGPWGRADVDQVRRAADGVDLVLLAVPDAEVGSVAAAVRPSPGTVVAHVSGSLPLDVVEPHPLRGSLHPLVSMPEPTVGAQRLVGAAYAVGGSTEFVVSLLREVVDALHGRGIEVPDEHRVRYHAAACIASNHLVALLGQVERVAASAGLPFDVFVDLARASLENAARLGPAAALTGPVARGDDAVVEAHLGALDETERSTYLALARAAHRLAHPDGTLPAWARPAPALLQQPAAASVDPEDARTHAERPGASGESTGMAG